MENLQKLLLEARNALAENGDPELVKRMDTAAGQPIATIMPKWWPQAVEFAWQTLKGYPQRGEKLGEVRAWLAQRAEDHARAVVTADQMLSGMVIETEGEAAVPISRLQELSDLLAEISALAHLLESHTNLADCSDLVWQQAEEIGRRVTQALERLQPLMIIQSDPGTDLNP